ncbi:hypothetical protein EVAR_33503_1 [Eumeta japonica]|uniref:Uncharacterized protein n=1 Tax=Eumeta variegata TaxID=151549 RepID=A0A4C1WHZ2_EUMVA|nr:hypothetical protein EVAR_33503_1 [Eumeta japonica]
MAMCGRQTRSSKRSRRQTQNDSRGKGKCEPPEWSPSPMDTRNIRGLIGALPTFSNRIGSFPEDRLEIPPMIGRTTFLTCVAGTIAYGAYGRRTSAMEMIIWWVHVCNAFELHWMYLYLQCHDNTVILRFRAVDVAADAYRKGAPRRPRADTYVLGPTFLKYDSDNNLYSILRLEYTELCNLRCLSSRYAAFAGTNFVIATEMRDRMLREAFIQFTVVPNHTTLLCVLTDGACASACKRIPLERTPIFS